MVKNFWKVVNEVIVNSDIIIEVLDARFADETRNKEIEDKVLTLNKKLVYVINKCDLVNKLKLERMKQKLKPSVYVSAVKKYGTIKLLRLLNKLSAGKDKVVIGVVGYPNTGKSSVINALKGRRSASVSPVGGHTKGKQLVRISKKIYLLDSPGVYPYKEKDVVKQALISSIDYSKVKEPVMVVMDLMKRYGRNIAGYYKVKYTLDYDSVIKEIAVKFKLLRKGNEPDYERAARLILRDLQKNRIRTG